MVVVVPILLVGALVSVVVTAILVRRRGDPTRNRLRAVGIQTLVVGAVGVLSAVTTRTSSPGAPSSYEMNVSLGSFDVGLLLVSGAFVLVGASNVARPRRAGYLANGVVVASGGAWNVYVATAVLAGWASFSSGPETLGHSILKSNPGVLVAIGVVMLVAGILLVRQYFTEAPEWRAAPRTRLAGTLADDLRREWKDVFLGGRSGRTVARRIPFLVVGILLGLAVLILFAGLAIRMMKG